MASCGMKTYSESYIQVNGHSCKDTKMATPLEFCWGHVTARNLVPLLRHVTNLWACGQAMWAWSFFDFFHFAILYSQRWILVIAFIKIWANCPCLFYMLMNTTLNHLGFVIKYFWLHLLISSFHNHNLSLSSWVLFWICGKVIWR